jgi:hypothetical protein
VPKQLVIKVVGHTFFGPFGLYTLTEKQIAGHPVYRFMGKTPKALYQLHFEEASKSWVITRAHHTKPAVKIARDTYNPADNNLHTWNFWARHDWVHVKISVQNPADVHHQQAVSLRVHRSHKVQVPTPYPTETTASPTAPPTVHPTVTVLRTPHPTPATSSPTTAPTPALWAVGKAKAKAAQYPAFSAHPYPLSSRAKAAKAEALQAMDKAPNPFMDDWSSPTRSPTEAPHGGSPAPSGDGDPFPKFHLAFGRHVKFQEDQEPGSAWNMPATGGKAGSMN